MTDVKLEDAEGVATAVQSLAQDNIWANCYQDLISAAALLRKIPELTAKVKSLEEQNHMLIELMRERIL